jgi:thiamine-phosphate pyrophosphorylase
VHLGGDAMTVKKARRICGEKAWVSVAAHSDDAVTAAVKHGADAALVSPIFPTAPPVFRSETRVRVARASDAPGAREKTPRGVDALRSARAVAKDALRLYALGGVNEVNTRACLDAGADGVAVIRALLASESPEGAARAFRDALHCVSW